MKENYTENQKLLYGIAKTVKKTPKLKNIKDKDGKVLTREKEIIDRWKRILNN